MRCYIRTTPRKGNREYSRYEFSDSICVRGTEDDDFGDVGQAQAFQCPCKQGHSKHGKQTLKAESMSDPDCISKRLTRGLSTQSTSNRLLNESAKMTACKGSCSALSRSWFAAAADFVSCFPPFFGGMVRYKDHKAGQSKSERYGYAATLTISNSCAKHRNSRKLNKPGQGRSRLGGRTSRIQMGAAKVEADKSSHRVALLQLYL